MAHFEAKKHGKTIESPKSNVVKGQMSAILWLEGLRKEKFFGARPEFFGTTIWGTEFC